MTIGRMAWKEGGGKSGWTSACNLALHGVSMGKPWTKRDSKARNTKYLYFEDSYEESIEEAWKVHEAWRDEILKNGGGTAADKEIGDGGGPATAKKAKTGAGGGNQEREVRKVRKA